MTADTCNMVILPRPGFEHRADLLAAELGVPACREAATEPDDFALALCLDGGGLSLKLPGPKAPGAVRCDFASGSARHRRLYGGGRGQDIAKAVGLNKKGFKPRVLDLTAGLGQDAFVLAALGARVTMVERHAVVHALLADGLARAKDERDDADLQVTLERMALVRSEAADYLRALTEPDLPDIIYLDPMFPPREKSAKVRKEMQVFHQLVGGNEDADSLLALALERVRYRVVVKRPAHAPFLAAREPGYSLKGKSTRFDIYPIRKLPV